MSDLVKQAIDRLNGAPSDIQEEIARLVLDYPDDDVALYQLTPEEHAAIDRADAEIARGAIATPEEVEAVLSKYRL